MSAENDRTSSTLLGHLCDPQNHDAWRVFLARYQPLIQGWCLRKGLNRSDADDVTLAVLAKVAQAMPAFRYERTQSFRAWLKTVVSNAVVDHRRSTAKPGARGDGGSVHQQAIDELPAEADDSADLSELLSAPLESDLARVQTVMARVQARVDEHVWQSFWLTAIDGLSAAEAAERSGVKVANIYVYRNRVTKMLREEWGQDSRTD